MSTKPEVIQALAEMSVTGAHEFFRSLPRCIGRMAAVTFQLEEGVDSAPSGGGGGHSGAGISKPTESRALWLLCEAPKLRERLEAEQQQLAHTIGHGLVLCQYLREVLGSEYGEAVERKYIDGLSWPQVADEMDISTSHAKRLGGVAMDWLDMRSDQDHWYGA